MNCARERKNLPAFCIMNCAKSDQCRKQDLGPRQVISSEWDRRKLIKVPEKYSSYGSTVRKYKVPRATKNVLNIANFLKEPNTLKTTNGNVNNVVPVALRPTSILKRRKHTCELSLKKISIQISEKY
jgi:hypothetical protein